MAIGDAPKQKTIEERNRSIVDTRSLLFSTANVSKQNILEIWNEIAKFGRRLESKYPNYKNYVVYHLLGGSTFAGTIQEDFPGDDSVVKFFEDLKDKYISKK